MISTFLRCPTPFTPLSYVQGAIQTARRFCSHEGSSTRAKIHEVAQKKAFYSNVHALPEATSSPKKGHLQFSEDEIKQLLNPDLFVDVKQKEVEDNWSSVNDFRSFVTSALNKNLTEVVEKTRRPDTPAVEIGAGIGYSTDAISCLIRTQPSTDECRLLCRANAHPIYNLDVQGIYNRLSQVEKKVPLFFALNVFDSMLPDKRRESLLQISHLQGSGDSLLLLHDVHPCLEFAINDLESSNPEHLALPFLPLTSEPAKFSTVLVPKKLIADRPTLDQLALSIQEDSLSIAAGYPSSRQLMLHKLQEEHCLQVIQLEDRYAENIKKDLQDVGYEVDIYYQNSFVCQSSPTGTKVTQDLVYKPVSDVFSVREWSLQDPRFLESLSRKGLCIPSHFNQQFLDSLRVKNEKIFASEFLVLNAKKV